MRLPRKNIMDLGGRPMIAYTIEAALECDLFEQVNVSTEDEEIAQIVREHGAAVPYMRPHDLATDQAGVVEVCLHMLDFFKSRGQTYDVMGVLLPSSPLRNAADIRGTYERFLKADADYAMAVTPYLHPPWQALVEQNGYLRPYWGPEIAHKKSQEIPELWVDTGAVYFAKVSAFRHDQTFYGRRLVGYPIAPERAIDVDNSFQLCIARLLMRDVTQARSSNEKQLKES